VLCFTKILFFVVYGRKKSKKNIRHFYLFGVLLYSGYSWYSYTGLYKFLAELQMDLIGAYYIGISIIFCILILGLPSWIIFGYENIEEQQIKLQEQENLRFQKEGDINVVKKRMLFSFLFGLCVVAFAFLVPPIIDKIYEYKGVPVLQEFDMDSGEKIPEGDNILLNVDGGKMWEEYSVWTKIGTSHETYFVPITPSKKTINQEPVLYFFKYNAGTGSPYLFGGFPLSISENGLPEIVEEQFITNGITPAPLHYVLSIASGDSKKESMKEIIPLLLLGFGLFIATIVPFAILFRYNRHKKLYRE
jgi:hypothetical protein